MNPRPKINLIYIVVVIAVYFYVHENYGNNLQQFILTFAVVDIVIAIFAIGKGLIKWQMWSIIAGGICAFIAYGSTKDISYASLFFQVLGGLVGVNGFIAKSTKKILD
jgi:uncharacterized membrane protein YbhN (UPF0104 family)